MNRTISMWDSTHFNHFSGCESGCSMLQPHFLLHKTWDMRRLAGSPECWISASTAVTPSCNPPSNWDDHEVVFVTGQLMWFILGSFHLQRWGDGKPWCTSNWWEDLNENWIFGAQSNGNQSWEGDDCNSLFPFFVGKISIVLFLMVWNQVFGTQTLPIVHLCWPSSFPLIHKYHHL